MLAPCTISRGVKACTWDPRRGVLGGLANVKVGPAGVAWVNAALHADLGGAAIPRLGRAPRYLIEVDDVGPATQALAELTLRECAELAAERTHVRVVDVSIYRVRHGITHGLPSKGVRRPTDRLELGSASAEQPHDFVFGQPVPAFAARQYPGRSRT